MYYKSKIKAPGFQYFHKSCYIIPQWRVKITVLILVLQLL